jgi:hypothetical protein
MINGLSILLSSRVKSATKEGIWTQSTYFDNREMNKRRNGYKEKKGEKYKKVNKPENVTYLYGA